MVCANLVAAMHWVEVPLSTPDLRLLHQVKELLGHSQISVSSQYYVHATDRLGEDTAARLRGAL